MLLDIYVRTLCLWKKIEIFVCSVRKKKTYKSLSVKENIYDVTGEKTVSYEVSEDGTYMLLLCHDDIFTVLLHVKEKS